MCAFGYVWRNWVSSCSSFGGSFSFSLACQNFETLNVGWVMCVALCDGLGACIWGRRCVLGVVWLFSMSLSGCHTLVADPNGFAMAEKSENINV